MIFINHAIFLIFSFPPTSLWHFRSRCRPVCLWERAFRSTRSTAGWRGSSTRSNMRSVCLRSASESRLNALTRRRCCCCRVAIIFLASKIQNITVYKYSDASVVRSSKNIQYFMGKSQRLLNIESRQNQCSLFYHWIQQSRAIINYFYSVFVDFI